jgi:hypothetical protein
VHVHERLQQHLGVAERSSTAEAAASEMSGSSTMESSRNVLACSGDSCSSTDMYGRSMAFLALS